MADETRDSHVRVDLSAVVIAIRAGEPCVLTLGAPPTSAIALPSGPLRPGHRTLQDGVRRWVEAQTNCRLGYVEQLYTFGDRIAFHNGAGDGVEHRSVSIAYLALVPKALDDSPKQGQWQSWYRFFPWEDMRSGTSSTWSPLVQRLRAWAEATGRVRDQNCVERARLTFGSGGAPWDEERVLERYEMLYGAELVEEAYLDCGVKPASEIIGLTGMPMTGDHRRILATAISRLRAKIKYRPVLFELMPPKFTLSELQRTAEAISGIRLHKQNFRRLIARQRLVEETGEMTVHTGGRPAKLMRFRREVTLERPAPGLPVGAPRRGGYP